VEELVYRNSGKDCSRHEIIISANKAESYLDIVIEDHGLFTDGNLTSIGEHGIVLDITKERLLHLYGNQQDLTVRLGQDGRIVVKIRLPFREMIVESIGTFVAEGAL
jgi:LytS/YehU family sensor histidine kinase